MLLERFIQRLELETSLIGQMFPGTVAGTFHQAKGKGGCRQNEKDKKRITDTVSWPREFSVKGR